MLNRNFWRRLAARFTAVCVFSFAVSATGFAQQITCPIAHPATNTSATATNSLNPCTIQPPLGFFTNAKTGTLENKSGGVLINESQFTNDGTVLNDAGAVLTNNASLTNAAGATLNNSGILNGTGTIQNSGTLNNLGNGTIFGVIDNLGGTINNKSGLPMGLASGSVIQGGTLNAGTTPIVWEDNVTLDGSTGHGALTLQGTLSNDAGVSTTLHVQGTINNEGTIQLNSAGFPTVATLSVDGNTTLQGGGKLNLLHEFITEGGSGSWTLTNVNNTIQGSAVITLGGFGNFVNQGTVNANISGQELLIFGGLTTSPGVMEEITNSGVMEATGGATLTFDISGNVNNNSGGSIVTGAGSTINNESGVTLFNNAGAKISNAGTFNNNGTVFGGGAITNSGIWNNTGVLQSGGTLTNATGGTLNNTGEIENLGTMNIAAGSSVTVASGVLVPSGTLVNDGSLNNAGNLSLQSGGSLSSGPGATVQNSGVIGIDAESSFVSYGNVVNEKGGTISNDGSFITKDGTTLDNYGAMVNGGPGAGAIMAIGGSFDNHAGSTFTNLGELVTDSQVINDFGAKLTTYGAMSIGNNLSNAGSLEIGAGGQISVGVGATLNNSGMFVNDAGGSILNYGSIVNNKGATFINDGSFINKTGSSFVNDGTFTLGAGSSFTDGGSFTNTGTLNVAPGATLSNPNGFVQTGGQAVVDGTLNSMSVKILGGTFSGAGTVTGSVLNSGGIFQPGANGTPGTLVVEDYEQQSGATFDELIGAPGNGALVAVAGGIQLDQGALLDIDLLNGFKPTDGETFDIMGAIQISGTFANAPTAGFQMDGFDWTITYDPGEIVLDAVSPVSSGGGNTPEPPSFLLLLPSLAALAFLRRRTKELHA